MKAYKFNSGWKIETANSVIVIRDDLTDTKGRRVTSVQVHPDKYAGESVNKVIPAVHNVRIVTLKKKNK